MNRCNKISDSNNSLMILNERTAMMLLTGTRWGQHGQDDS